MPPTLRLAAAGGGTRSGVLRGVPPGSALRRHLVSGLTDETAAPASPECAAGEIDPSVLAAVREINARFVLTPPVPAKRMRAATGTRRSRPYRGHSDELDLDRTIEVLLDDPRAVSDALIVREAEITRREVVLVVDVSGSMRGDRALLVAAAVGALGSQLRSEDLALIAFWSDAALVTALGEGRSALALVRDTLGLRARGLTNVAFPLAVAGEQLSAGTAAEQRVILLSDCVHNAGPDPRESAVRLPQLDVLYDSGGESDREMAHDLARLGRGRLREVHHPADLAEALTALFA